MDPAPAYCAHCGLPADARDHEACQRAAALDPPRFCPRCGRRMVVKVTPDRWTARCSRHGAAPGAASAPSRSGHNLSR